MMPISSHLTSIKLRFDLVSNFEMLRDTHMFLATIFAQQGLQIGRLHIISLICMLSVEHGSLRWHSDSVDF